MRVTMDAAIPITGSPSHARSAPSRALVRISRPSPPSAFRLPHCGSISPTSRSWRDSARSLAHDADVRAHRMTRDWRRLVPWRRKEAPVQTPPDDKQGSRKEPVFPRDEKVERMEFLLSLKRRGISDAAVLRAMDAVPREQFVLPASTEAAYADQAVRIACGESTIQPYVRADMTDEHEWQPQLVSLV